MFGVVSERSLTYACMILSHVSLHVFLLLEITNSRPQEFNSDQDTAKGEVGFQPSKIGCNSTIKTFKKWQGTQSYNNGMADTPETNIPPPPPHIIQSKWYVVYKWGHIKNDRCLE